jgi:hypothetical protein
LNTTPTALKTLRNRPPQVGLAPVTTAALQASRPSQRTRQPEIGHRTRGLVLPDRQVERPIHFRLQDGSPFGFAGLWTCKTDDQGELIEWMRRYNADPAHHVKLQFYGFDSPTEMVGSDSSSATNGSSMASVAGKNRLPMRPWA